MKAREAIREYRVKHWAEVIRQRAESGLTIKEFCQGQGITRDQYFYWQRILRDSACEHLSKSAAQIEHRTQMFAEVTVAQQLIGSSAPASEMSGEIRIEAVGIKMTAVETAKENGLKPFEYLKYLFESVPNATTGELDCFLPWSESIPER